MKRASLLTLTLIGAFSAIQAAWAVDYPLPPTGSRLVGQNQTYTVQEGDKNLQAIARRFDTAAMLILEANNTIAPVPKPGTTITIPSQLLLPDAPRQGIIVNLAELRLYYYPPGENIVQVYPIGIGLQGLETPVMETRVGQKIPNPTWTPTAGIIPWNLTGCVMLKYIDHYRQKNSRTFRQCRTRCQQALRNLKTIRL